MRLARVRAAAVGTAEGIRMKAEPRRSARGPVVLRYGKKCGRLRPAETPAGKAGIVALQQKHSWRICRLSAYVGESRPARVTRSFAQIAAKPAQRLAGERSSPARQLCDSGAPQARCGTSERFGRPKSPGCLGGRDTPTVSTAPWRALTTSRASPSGAFRSYPRSRSAHPRDRAPNPSRRHTACCRPGTKARR
jgi:hypothetical protein